MTRDPAFTRSRISTRHGDFVFHNLDQLERENLTRLSRLPFSIRVLLESILRSYENQTAATLQDVINLAAWEPNSKIRPTVPFFPGRVIMQDFSGVPALVDLAALRSAVARSGGNPQQVNPVIPVDLVIDHSLEVNYSALPDAFQRNLELEYQRNTERYTFLRWGQKAFKNLRIIPPGAGIIHQVNLEYLSPVVLTQSLLGELTAFPDTVIGTDSHTTMINGLGVVGWGVGGIEAVAAMLGEPFEMPVPDVVGFRLFGELREGVTPTDLTLKITQILRASGVVGKYVEFFGRGLKSLSLPDRAMIANMSPENGATISYFPVDDETLAYLRLTGRPPAQVELVETYFKTQQLYRTEDTPDPLYSETIELDIGTVEPSLAGPKRPQDRVPLSQVGEGFRLALTRERSERGYALGQEQVSDRVQFNLNGNSTELTHGAVVLAAITSCTNTSNPYVMVGAGLLAKKAVEKGLVVSPTVKTSLAPGSRVVTEYLERAGLLQPLSALGFDIVGYGCTTCIGNSGPLAPAITQALSNSSIIAASVISGNRNFEGRVHPLTQANYLASPPLVIAYALAGTVDIDLASQSLGLGTDRQPVYLKDIWPSTAEIQDVINRHLTPELFTRSYTDIFSGSQAWQLLEAGDSPLYPWNPGSTYIQEPPYINKPATPATIQGARVLLYVGDSVTTDHISPAGSIPANSVAGLYLQTLGVEPRDFNSYGSRRGNDRVLTRGTFGNPRLKNNLLQNVEGSLTLHLPSAAQMTIYDAAMKYQAEGIPLIILAGKEYGTGSSRDWAAKGTALLGVKAVIAESFERIHRANLVGMSVLPLQFKPGEGAQQLGLTGQELFSIHPIQAGMAPRSELQVLAKSPLDGSEITFSAIARLDTPLELDYYLCGGLLPNLLHKLVHPRG